MMARGPNKMVVSMCSIQRLSGLLSSCLRFPVPRRATEENIRLGISLALADRIQPRRGDLLYQVISHSLTGITRVLLEKVFPASSVT